MVKNKEGQTEYQLRNKTVTRRLNIDPAPNFQPFVLDFLGQSENQFIYMDKNNHRYFYSSTKENNELKNYLHKTEIPEYKEPPISTPHSSSFIDINGDCIPDIVLTSFDDTNFYIEYWLFIESEHYELYNVTTIKAKPEQISQLVFSDFGNLIISL